jgi:glycopeptide antibiotics resistance protein
MARTSSSTRDSIWLCRVIIAVLLTIIFTTGQAAIERYNPTAWWGIALAAVLAWLFAEWALRYINVSPRTQYFLVVTGAIALYADSFGTMASLYSNYSWYDNAVHGIATAAITFWLWYILRAMLKKRRIRLPLVWHMWLVLVTATFFGLLFEILEYTADMVLLKDHYWIGPAPDTVEDVLFNTIGALAIVSILGWKEKQKK